jgi:putative endonuclease
MSLAVGKAGERIAENYLRKKGYRIFQKNFRTSLGEIDMICLEGETIVFVEVKTNSSTDFGVPECRVDHRKQKQMAKVALGFHKQKEKTHCDCRFDVISILLRKDSEPKIEHIENAFFLNEE